MIYLLLVYNLCLRFIWRNQAGTYINKDYRADALSDFFGSLPEIF